MSPRIVTLTLNPAVDTAFEAERVVPRHKIRTFNETHDPGGGGVNVARVLAELGAETCAIVLAGGVTGAFLVELLDGYAVPCRAVPIAGTTRISTTVHDRSSGEEYRFVPEGPEVSEAELAAALGALDDEPGDWVVLSGSLPRGLPADTYARIVAREAGRGRQVVLDSSGESLRAALGHGLALIKPSERELAELVGPLPPEQAARDLVRSGAAERVAVSLGAAGGLIATESGLARRPAIPVEVRGAVGAGDSFLAAMTLALATGSDAEDALLWGLAAGAAAVSRGGTAHPRREDVAALYEAARAATAV
jgi:6-phosphofructokinase 2